MSKNKLAAYRALGIAFLLFNVIAFTVPTIRFIPFWVAYGFTIVAFIVQIFIWETAFKDAYTLKSKFFGFPLVHVSTTFLIAQMIAFSVFLVHPLVPIWVSFLTCALILGIFGISLIATEVGKDEVIRVEQHVQMKVHYIKEILTDLELLAGEQKDETIKSALSSLAENVRFSDPMSHDSLLRLEYTIWEKVELLKENQTADALTVIAEIEKLLLERNKTIKYKKS